MFTQMFTSCSRFIEISPLLMPSETFEVSLIHSVRVMVMGGSDIGLTLFFFFTESTLQIL